MKTTPNESAPNSWTVLDGDATVLTRNYVFDPKTQANANTLVARMPDGKLLVFSAPTTDDAAHADLAEFGEVGAVVANNGFHHLGQPDWRARYPKARFFTPSEAMARIAKKNPEAPTFEPLSELQGLLGDSIQVTEVPNSKCGESWIRVKVGGGYVWYVSDILANMPELPKAFPIRQLFKWTGSAPGYSVFGLAMRFIVKDRKAVLKHMREQLESAPPTVVVPGHGERLADAELGVRTRELLDRVIG